MVIKVIISCSPKILAHSKILVPQAQALLGIKNSLPFRSLALE